MTCLDDAIPWLAWEAIKYLDKTPLEGKRVLEWGCGGSTRYFARRGAYVLSIEHSGPWAAKVSEVLRQDSVHLSQTDGRALVALVRPDAYAASSCKSHIAKGKTFSAYVEFAVNCALFGRWPNVILIDGRARPACLRWVMNYVVPGNIVVMDDTARGFYHRVMTEFRSKHSGHLVEHVFCGDGPHSNGVARETTVWEITR